MNDDKQIFVQGPDDAFAQTAKGKHAPAFYAFERGRDGSEKEWAGDPDLFKRLPDDPWSERVKVEFDVGKFWHG